MKAVNFIRHLVPLTDGPKVEIIRRGQTLYSKEVNHDNKIYEFEILEKLCKKYGLILVGFAVENNTLRINVV